MVDSAWGNETAASFVGRNRRGSSAITGSESTQLLGPAGSDRCGAGSPGTCVDDVVGTRATFGSTGRRRRHGRYVGRRFAAGSASAGWPPRHQSGDRRGAHRSSRNRAWACDADRGVTKARRSLRDFCLAAAGSRRGAGAPRGVAVARVRSGLRCRSGCGARVRCRSYRSKR